MYWEIPIIPDKTIIKKPKYNIIISFYIVVITAIYIYGSSLVTEQKISLFIYLIPTVTLFFFFILGFLFIRHQHSIVTYTNWEQEKQETKNEWQAWCQLSIMSLANVIYTPDKEGTNVFLMDTESLPMYPDKPRSFSEYQGLDTTLLSNIDKEIEKQCPHYRQFLSKIYLLHDGKSENIEDMIFKLWDFHSIKILDHQDILLDNEENETFLIVTIQSQKNYSEFISAQLFSSEEKLIHHAEKCTAIERVMTINTQDIDNEINKYIDYSGISQKEHFQTWISNGKQPVIDKIILSYSDKNVEFDTKHPIYSLDLSYSKPHKNAFFTYLSLLTDISNKTNQDQVLIHFNQDDSGYAVYIRNRL
ncbi:hypothetical protein [Providencia burhodogranariea]|uniref:Uncharacterized protein n=1 Tax=Providencia burhodogranariea DSM 19968 TaxID=1141662 RepID=K8WV83_9GAMM|nr:hypothetical protein [Providencia burhodogranariea]EKT64488.1 hypothetical protein OOA_02712 [Providencia burhodogranariea DSM 19968]